MEHRKFPKIPRLENLTCQVTEKLDGTNALIALQTNEDGTRSIKIGSRNRWITVEDDNQGFAKFCVENIDWIQNLPDGFHYGEFMGPKINGNRIGLDTHKLYLFDQRLRSIDLGSNIDFVPVLIYQIELESFLEAAGQYPVYFKGIFDNEFPEPFLQQLRPEGIMIFVREFNQYIKVIWDK